jgi:hypothetical protein
MEGHDPAAPSALPSQPFTIYFRNSGRERLGQFVFCSDRVAGGQSSATLAGAASSTPSLLLSAIPAAVGWGCLSFIEDFFSAARRRA